MSWERIPKVKLHWQRMETVLEEIMCIPKKWFPIILDKLFIFLFLFYMAQTKQAQYWAGNTAGGVRQQTQKIQAPQRVAVKLLPPKLQKLQLKKK